MTTLQVSPAGATRLMNTVAITGRRECRLIDKPSPLIRRNYVLLKVHVAPMCNDLSHATS